MPSIKYFVSHGLSHILTTSRNSQAIKGYTCGTGEMSVGWRGAGRVLADAAALAGGCLGVFARWDHAHAGVVPLAAVCAGGVAVCSLSGAAYYYFAARGGALVVARLWLGALLGYLALTHDEGASNRAVLQATYALLVTAAGLHVMAAVVERLSGRHHRHPASPRRLHLGTTSTDSPPLVSVGEVSEVAGLLLSFTLVASLPHLACLATLLAALLLSVLAMRLGSFLSSLVLFYIVIMARYTSLLADMHVRLSPYAASLLLVRQCADPVLDLLLGTGCSLDRWLPLLNLPHFQRQLLILTTGVAEAVYYAVSGVVVSRHKEWYIVVPLFCAFTAVWTCLHIVLLCAMWLASNKVSECQRLVEGQGHRLHSALAARGVRHFSLVWYRLVALCLVSTVFLAMLGYTTRTPVSVASQVLVLPLETCFLSLLHHLGTSLGGTCTGLAFVVPTTGLRGDENKQSSRGSPLILPPGLVDQVNIRCTNILQAINRFFSHHLIVNHGCDYSWRGLTLDQIHSKVRDLFAATTEDGTRFDTYIVYYSGPTNSATGDWALLDNDTLCLSTLLSWWQELNCGSRLLLVLDTMSSHLWLPKIRQVAPPSYIALQTVYLTAPGVAAPPLSPAKVPMYVGDFTCMWVAHNSGESVSHDFGDDELTQVRVEEEKNGSVSGSPVRSSPRGGSGASWHSGDLAMEALYAVSPAWTDSSLRQPTREEVERRWRAMYPDCMNNLLCLVGTIAPGDTWSGGQLSPLCSWVWRCIKRTRQKWFPPTSLHIGHGFKLLRS